MTIAMTELEMSDLPPARAPSLVGTLGPRRAVSWHVREHGNIRRAEAGAAQGM